MSQQDMILAEGWDGYGSPPASVAYILSRLWDASTNLPAFGGGGGDTSGLAPINSPTFTGTPTAPTPSISDNSSRLATTAMVQAALSLVSAGLDYLGTWDATTNTPTLSNGSGIDNSGGFYIVAVSGTTPLDGTSSWAVGDWCISDDVGWKRVIQTDAVGSVFGRTGNVTASPGDYNAGQVTETSTRKLMTDVERTKLAGIATGATVNATDAALRDRTTHTGTQAISTVAGLQTALDTKTTTVFGRTGAVVAVSGDYNADQVTETTGGKILTAAERTKLAGIATGATVNATDASLRDRTTHTGVQATSTITGLDTALAGKAPTAHTHVLASITDAGTLAGLSTVGTTQLANDAVTLAKVANAAASSKLLGSGASGAGVDYAEITLGTNLSMTGTTLNVATGGGSGVTLPVKDVRDYSPVGDGIANDTTALQNALNAAPINAPLALEAGKTYLVNDLTMQIYGKLIGNGAILKAAPGTVRVLTLSANNAIQTADRVLVEGLTIDGSFTSGVVGLYTLNHGSIVIRDVGIRRCTTGAWIQHAQFGDCQNLRCWDNTGVGLYLRGNDVSGGANSWTFTNYTGVGNAVGLVVNKGLYLTSHSNYFRNPVLISNTVCGAAVFDSYDCTFDGLSNELQAAGAATFAHDGLTIKKSSIHVSGGHLQLTHPRMSDGSNTDPCIILENGARLSQAGSLSGYGGSAGIFIQCDATSAAQADNMVNVVGTCDLPAGLTGTIISGGCAVLLPGASYNTDTIPNEIADPYMATSDITGATSTSNVIDTAMGPCREVVFAAGAGTSTANRSRWTATAGAAGRRAIAFSVMSNIDIKMGVGWSGNLTNRYFFLKAGVWRRLLHISDEVASGSQQFLVWAAEAGGPTVRFTRWQQCSGAIGHAIYGQIVTMARGALNQAVKDTATAAALAAVGNNINVTGKYIGKQVWDSTGLRPVWAAGSAANAIWKDGANATVHTPA